MDINDLYQELIIDHGTHPRNCCALPNANGCAEGFNPLCGDKVKIYLDIKNQVIEKASFTGNGCAISTASASLMTEVLMGKSTNDAIQLSKTFQCSLTGELCDTTCAPCLGKLEALAGVKAFPARVKCATLAWHALEAAIRQESAMVTTEAIEENI